MPGFDGKGPRGQGMFTGRGEGLCILCLANPEPADQPLGYAGVQGTPVYAHPDFLPPPPETVTPTRWPSPNPCLLLGSYAPRGRGHGRCHRHGRPSIGLQATATSPR